MTDKDYGCCKNPSCLKTVRTINVCANCGEYCMDCEINKRANKMKGKVHSWTVKI